MSTKQHAYLVRSASKPDTETYQADDKPPMVSSYLYHEGIWVYLESTYNLFFVLVCFFETVSCCVALAVLKLM